MATVSVGTEAKQFTLHRNVLIKSSPFFHKALNGGFVERDGNVKLLDGDVVAFKIYVDWLYHGKVRAGPQNDPSNLKEEDDSSDGSESTESDVAFSSLTECLILADLIQDDAFYNACVDGMIEVIQSITCDRYPLSIVAPLYKGLPKTSPVLRLLVDMWVQYGEVDWFNDGAAERGTIEFWCALAKGLMVEDDNPTDIVPWLDNRCQYHKHEKKSGTG